MSNDINVLGGLLRQLQQTSRPSSGFGASGVQGAPFAGQNLPLAPPDLDDDGDSGAGGSSASAVASASQPSRRFSADLLGTLLQTQTQPPTSADVAKQLISNLDANGDGSLSLSEVQAALGGNPASATASTASTSASDPLSQLTQAFAKVDGNGDGQLSSDELAAVLDKALQSSQASNVGHHHPHHHAYQAAQAAADAAAATATGATTTTGSVASSTSTGASVASAVSIAA